MTRGASIPPQLQRAIQGSRIAIVLLSENYASSSWCLDELVKIIKCRQKWGQTVITIFYKVEPTDVKKQVGEFGKVFKETCKGKTYDVIQKWREALAEVATISGYDSRNWINEAAAIEEISTNISKMLNHLAPSQYLDHFIGMKAHIDEMQLFLRFDLVKEVRMIGICGPLGIGKSTICRYLFNEYSNNFPLKTIMVNIKQSYPSPCLDEGNAQLQLQNDMLSKLIKHKDIEITHLGAAQDRLKDKKVLLVLDDVDRHAQLGALAGDSRWFGPGSRIIVATEDLRVLLAHGIDLIYKVNYPSTDEAFRIFCMYAFPQKYPDDGFTELARQITYLVGNLPLGLQAIGSYFLRMPKYEWIEALPKLRSCLDGNIEDILKFSYNAVYGEICEFSSSSSHPPSHNWKYDVFLSFYGKDVRTTFLSHLLNQFKRKGINTFTDNGMKRGAFINPELRRAIKESRTAIVLLSENYASSSWCLNELVEIIKCKKMFGQTVIPIFYQVERTDVKNRTGGFGRILKKTCKGKKMQKWIEALAEVATIASFGLIIWVDESAPIEAVDTVVLKILNHLPPSHYLNHLIVMKARLEKMQQSLRFDLVDGVRMIGICKYQFNQLSSNFPLKTIMVNNIKGSYSNPCLDEGSVPLHLHNHMFSKIGAAQDRSKDKKVVVFDDVNQPAQLVALAEDSQWFGPGTATKDLRVLLDWEHSPMTYWPTTVKLENLVELNMSQNNFEKLWDRSQPLQRLKCMDSENVRELPCLSTATSLKEPSLENCSSLVELNATNLETLHLSHSSSLVEIPSSIENFPKLKSLTLRGCPKLKVLPTNIRYPCSLTTLC